MKHILTRIRNTADLMEMQHIHNISFYTMLNSLKYYNKIFTLDYVYIIFVFLTVLVYICVLDHGEGVCADPGKGDATLGVGGPGPQKGTVSIS
jgi:hypothetical protein